MRNRSRVIFIRVQRVNNEGWKISAHVSADLGLDTSVGTPCPGSRKHNSTAWFQKARSHWKLLNSLLKKRLNYTLCILPPLRLPHSIKSFNVTSLLNILIHIQRNVSFILFIYLTHNNTPWPSVKCISLSFLVDLINLQSMCE